VALLERECGKEKMLTVTEQYLQGTKWTVQRAIDEITQNFLDQAAVVHSKVLACGNGTGREMHRAFSEGTQGKQHSSDSYAGTFFDSAPGRNGANTSISYVAFEAGPRAQ